MTETPNNDVAEQVLCECVLSVPISHLGLEVSVPLQGWGPLFEQLGIKVVTDPAGRAAITALAARRLLSELARRDRFAAEGRDRQFEKLAKQYPVTAGGVPAIEGASPFESMAASPGYQLPSEEFSSGREKPNFLADELAEGARYLAEQQRRNQEKEKDRLAKQMKDRLR